jgi:hypothetical protein
MDITCKFIKIDLDTISLFLFNMTPFHELELGREYFILRSNGKKYKGIFDDYKYSYINHDEAEIFAKFETKTLYYFYTAEDKFYDVNYIRMNAYVARQQMEHRSVNMILKRLVNEHFEW